MINHERKKIFETIKQKLIAWKKALEKEEKEANFFEEQNEKNTSEIADAAFQQENILINLKTSKQKKHLLNEINHALEKIKNNTYGICEESKEIMSLKRLQANPIARYCIETQNYMEKNKEKNLN